MLIEETSAYGYDDMAILYNQNPEMFNEANIKSLSAQSVSAQMISEDEIVPLTVHQGVVDYITVPGEVNTYSFTCSNTVAQKCGIQIVVRDVPANLDPVIKITYNDTGETIRVNNAGLGEREEYRSGLFNVRGGDYTVTVEDKNGNVNLDESYKIIYTIDYSTTFCSNVPMKSFSVTNTSRLKVNKTVEFDVVLKNYTPSTLPSDTEMCSVRISSNVSTSSGCTYDSVLGGIKFNASGEKWSGLENNVVYLLEEDEHETVRQTATVSSTISKMSSGTANITVKLYFQYRYKNEV